MRFYYNHNNYNCNKIQNSMNDNNPVNPFVGYSSAVVHSLLSQEAKGI